KTLPKDDFDKWVKDMKSVEKPVAATSSQAKEGEKVFNKSCAGCHAVTPTGEKAKGPKLTNFGDRDLIAGYLDHDEKNLKKWIKDPESIKPGNKMTDQYKVSDEDIDALSAYLMERKVDK